MMLCRDVTYPLTCFLKMFCRKSNLVTDTVKDISLRLGFKKRRSLLLFGLYI